MAASHLPNAMAFKCAISADEMGRTGGGFGAWVMMVLGGLARIDEAR